jgi:GAF domain-containing protein
VSAHDPRALHRLRQQNAVVLYGLSGSDAKRVAADAELGEIAATLRRYLGGDYAGVHVLDDDMQVTIASSEADTPPPVPRGDSMCAAVLDERGDAALIEVPNATLEPALRDNPFVDGERGAIRFYAAAPLRTPSGVTLGTLCVIGHEPRTLDDDERHLLLHLGYAVVHVLERYRRGPGGAPPA